MFSIISAILHLGNIGFSEEEGLSMILKPDIVDTVSKVNKIKILFFLCENNILDFFSS